MSCSALMAFQIVSTNDVPEIMFGLMADYKNGEGGWFIIGRVGIIKHNYGIIIYWRSLIPNLPSSSAILYHFIRSGEHSLPSNGHRCYYRGI